MIFLTGTITSESEDFRKLNLRDRSSNLSTQATYYIRRRRQTVELLRVKLVAHLGLFQASLVVYAARPLIFIETGLIEGGPNGYYSPRA